jgi:hypothetical protein
MSKHRLGEREFERGKTFYPPQQGMLPLMVESSNCSDLFVDWDTENRSRPAMA